MTCHSCPHDREIARLRAICMRCTLSDVPTNGTTSLDALTDGAIETGELRAKVAADVSAVATFNPDGIDEPADDAAGRVLPSMPEGAEEYVLELLRLFASLTLADVLVVHGFMRGWGIVRMADRYGESKQAISARVRNALKRNPWLAELARSRIRRNAQDRFADWAMMRDGTPDGDRIGAAWAKWCNMHGGSRAEANRAANGTRAEHPCRSGTVDLAAFAGKSPQPSRLEATTKPRERPPA